MAEHFKPGDLVWAKLDDYPYWPAKVASQCIADELKTCKEDEGVAVLFLGTELTYSLVNEDCVKDFEKNFAVYSRTKVRKTSKEDFERALEMAKVADTVEEPPLELDEEEEVAKATKMSSVHNREQAESKTKKAKKPEGKNEKTVSETKGIDKTTVGETDTVNRYLNAACGSASIPGAAQKESKSDVQHETNVGLKQRNKKLNKATRQGDSERENHNVKEDDVFMNEVGVESKRAIVPDEDVSKNESK